MSSPPFRIFVPGSIVLDIYTDTGAQFLGGAEFNFAYHIRYLIGSVDFIARIGRDAAGEIIRRELRSRSFPSEWIQVDPIKKTKTVQVYQDDQGQPRFIIPQDVASEYLEFPPLGQDRLSAYDLTYFGTTLQHGPQSRRTLRRLLKLCPSRKFCDLNLRTNTYTIESVDYSLHTCDILKLNHEELETVAGLFQISGNPQARLEIISQRFDIPTLCLTLASAGSLLYHQGQWTSHPAHACKVKDTVGAGDAFSACLAIGLLKDWDAGRILDWASDFAAAVCQIQGAVPVGPDFYTPFIERYL